MEIVYLTEAVDEMRTLPPIERRAMLTAFDKLNAIGDQLPFPHSSQVKGSRLRELRPRAGRSPWRALYQRIGGQLVIAAICPEAQHDPRGFTRGLALANDRLNRYQGTNQRSDHEP